MRSRRSSVAFAALLALGLSGCAATPAPTPSPTATGFATEEGAFAAAEETLAAYAEANNEVDLSDPETFEAVYAWTTGDEYANVREDLTQLAAQGLTLQGDAKFAAFKGIEFDADQQQITAVVCVDVSEVDIIDEDGHSVVPEARPERVGNDLSFSLAKTSTGLAVARVTQNSENGACTP